MGDAPGVESLARYTANLESMGIRRLGLLFAYIFVFFRFSYLHETLTFLGGVSYILFGIAPFALIGLVASDGLRRAMVHRSTVAWIVFASWMLFIVPFSVWKGDSLRLVMTYWRTELPMLFFISGLVVTWREWRRMLAVIAVAGLVLLSTGRMFLNSQYGGRAAMEFSTIANPNDFAAHLVLILPFLLFFVIKPKTAIVIRLAALACISGATFTILSTGSRGALIALVVMAIILFASATGAHKVLVLLVAPVFLVGMLLLMPTEVFNRITAFTAEVDDQSASAREAAESRLERTYLLKQSIRYTLENPIFGVGPGQFSSKEGRDRREEGLRGSWHQTHNVYTQISSECGLIGLAIYLTALIGTFSLFRRIHKTAKLRKLPEVESAALCMLVSMGGFCSAVFFLTMGYRYYLLAFTGLAVAMHHATQLMFAQAAASPAPAAPPLMPQGPPFARRPLPVNGRF